MDVEQIPLIGGHAAVDFVNTVEGRHSDAVLNYLSDYDRLAQWCGRAGLLSPAEVARVRREAKQHPVIAARIWREAMALRENLSHVFGAATRGEEPAKAAIAELSAVVECAFAHRRLQPAGRGQLDWGWDVANGGLEIIVWELVLSAANLLTDADGRGRIKMCANGPCDWMFLDTSRTGQRRWCRMNVCGNASKVRRFRERQRIGH